MKGDNHRCCGIGNRRTDLVEIETVNREGVDSLKIRNLTTS